MIKSLTETGLIDLFSAVVRGCRVRLGRAWDSCVSQARARERAAMPIHAQAQVTGEDVSRGKPAPDGFLLAASKLGIDPAHCVGYEGACRAGMASSSIVLGHVQLVKCGRLTGPGATLGRRLCMQTPNWEWRRSARLAFWRLST